MRSLSRLVVTADVVPTDRHLNVAADAEVSAQTIIAGMRGVLMLLYTAASHGELDADGVSNVALLLDDLAGVLESIASLDDNLNVVARQHPRSAQRGGRKFAEKIHARYAGARAARGIFPEPLAPRLQLVTADSAASFKPARKKRAPRAVATGGNVVSLTQRREDIAADRQRHRSDLLDALAEFAKKLPSMRERPPSE